MKPMILQMTPWRFFKIFLEPYKLHLTGMFFCGLIWGIQQSLTPFMLKIMIDSMTNLDTSDFDCISELSKPALGYLIISAVTVINFRCLDLIRLRFYPELRKRINTELFSVINKNSVSYFQDYMAGTLGSKVSDVSESTLSLLRKGDDFIAQLLSVLIASGMMFFIHPVFTLCLLCWFFGFLSISLLSTKKSRILSGVFTDSLSGLKGQVIDVFANIFAVKLFTRTKTETDQVRKISDEVLKNEKGMLRQILMIKTGQDISFIILISGMLAILIYLYSEGKVTKGDFVLILNISFSVSYGMCWLGNQLSQFSEDLGRCTAAISVIYSQDNVPESSSGRDLKIHQGAIEFKDVYFSYPQSQQVFSALNFTFEAGTKTGLVGFSGAGKSTLISLILKLFEPDQGAVLIDGNNISEINQESLRKNISLIPQDISLFHRSLMDNIRCGNPGASDTEVIEASKKAFCHDFIMKLPQNYQTKVGERGLKLSGGQRQRIAIARAFLKNAPVVILDEATSALDSATENLIQKSLENFTKGKTTISIAHRLSTLSGMDKIIVIDKGIIVEQGNHNQLIKKSNGFYKKLWTFQSVQEKTLLTGSQTKKMALTSVREIAAGLESS